MTRAAVIGAGSWGTAFGAVVATNADVMLWARDPDLATRIDAHHENDQYLPGIRLPSTLHATSGPRGGV